MGWPTSELLQLLLHTSQLAQVEKNRSRLLELTSKFHPGALDLLCLPEMVLTGYTFPSASAIKPYLERPGEGPTSLCCSELAKRLRCHVIAGYPEVFDGKNSTENAVGYNSAVICGPDGRFRGGYRKSNLFETDMTWAIAGSGFDLFDLGDPLGQISLGICMDLNPFPPAIWTSRDGPYELASFAYEKDVSLLVVLCAWLDSKIDPDAMLDLNTVNYWLARLLPLWQRIFDKQSEKETIVVICNRAGSEGDTVFAGTSAIFRLSPNLESPEIIGIMPRREEAAQVWNI